MRDRLPGEVVRQSLQQVVQRAQESGPRLAVGYVREHEVDRLADELELDPARIDESTHFKRDLEADSLDLYGLVQELEDTYGVRMSDEEAARIRTVGQAVDFVLANLGDREPRP